MTIDDGVYDSDFDDSDFKNLVHSGKDIQIIYFDNIEQFQHSEKNLIKLVGLIIIQTSHNIL